MAHSAACSSSASQSSPTRRPNAETPHQLLSLPVSEKTTDTVLYHLHITCCRPPPLLAHARVILYVQWRRNRSGRSGFGRYTFLGRKLIFITCYNIAKASLVPLERAQPHASTLFLEPVTCVHFHLKYTIKQSKSWL